MSYRSMAWWPGFLNLWTRGELYSLFVALLFAALLNIALLATLVWQEWLTAWTVRILWGFLLSAGLWSSVSGRLFCRRTDSSASKQESNRLLAMSQKDYLRGDYLAAEASLHRILSSGQEDVEAALLLAAVLRRTGRPRQALECLERLERFDSASIWGIEIQNERRKCSAGHDLDS
jgi:tetratricopeptide (TPR) repeat protein